MNRISRYVIAALAILLWHSAGAQITNRENYDLRESDPLTACRGVRSTMARMPSELRFGSKVTDDSVYVIFPDLQWFEALMPDRTDGIAIDLVQKKQYQCDNIMRFVNSKTHKGYLMPPVYRDEMRKRVRMAGPSHYILPIGKLPAGISREETEANYFLIEDRNVCLYTAIVNVDFHGWMLLETGLYYDTLSTAETNERYRQLHKKLHFTIPFEKNKATYNQEDVRPMFDSLRLTDYAITSLNIRAYTSVEGSYERNEKLQTERANSLVAALQAYQSEKIKFSMQASENWVEFFADVVPLAPAMASLSKDEVKQRLSNPQLLAKLEPMLQKHRKGFVEIELEKRLVYRDADSTQLLTYFNQAIQKRDIKEAQYLQEVAFTKVIREDLPIHFIGKLEIPEVDYFGTLLNNRIAFYYDHYLPDNLGAIADFEKLLTLLPNNPKVRYNLCVLKLRVWAKSGLTDENTALLKEINKLAPDIHPTLVQRLRVNYKIILSEYHDKRKEFGKKDLALKSILDTYKSMQLTDDDLVNLAKYFSNYSRFDWAERVLTPRVNQLDVDEDLLFYYLALTIYEEKNTRRADYRRTMLNAINTNRERFCRLFNSTNTGGISFQLLTDEFLKKTYCENCK